MLKLHQKKQPVVNGSPKSIDGGKPNSPSPLDERSKNNNSSGHVQSNTSTIRSQRSTVSNGEGQPPSVLNDQPATNDKAESPSFVYLRLPYIRSIGAQFRRRVTAALKKCYHSIKLRLIFISRPNFPNAKKDVLPTLQRSNIVYEFTCHCDSRYTDDWQNDFLNMSHPNYARPLEHLLPTRLMLNRQLVSTFENTLYVFQTTGTICSKCGSPVVKAHI